MPALQPLSSSHRHTGPWEAVRLGGLAPVSHLESKALATDHLGNSCRPAMLCRELGFPSQCLDQCRRFPITVYAPPLISGASGACACLLQGSLPCSGSEVRETVFPGLQAQPWWCLRAGRGPAQVRGFLGWPRREGAASVWILGVMTRRAGQESQACCWGVCCQTPISLVFGEPWLSCQPGDSAAGPLPTGLLPGARL